MFKVGDEIIWPIRNLPGKIIAEGVTLHLGENFFVAHVPNLHRTPATGPHDGIVYIRETGTTIDGTPVRKRPVLVYRNVYLDGRVVQFSKVRQIPMGPILGYLVAEKEDNGTFVNIRFMPEVS